MYEMMPARPAHLICSMRSSPSSGISHSSAFFIPIFTRNWSIAERFDTSDGAGTGGGMPPAAGTAGSSAAAFRLKMPLILSRTMEGAAREGARRGEVGRAPSAGPKCSPSADASSSNSAAFITINLLLMIRADDSSSSAISAAASRGEPPCPAHGSEGGN